MSKAYVLRVRQLDGSWMFDLDDPMTKREAELAAKKNRILAGVLCQVWPEAEALAVEAAQRAIAEADNLLLVVKTS